MDDKQLERSIYIIDSAVSLIVAGHKESNPEMSRRIHAHWENLKIHLRDNIKVDKSKIWTFWNNAKNK
tara:strand:- start:2014 stop:2217 length:204 start_codon:yes stop_codon:yes gene_type:complete